MKLFKNFLITLCLVMTFSSLQAQLKLGGGVGYGFDIEELGILVRGAYPITEEITGNGTFLYYLVGDGLSLWELDLDGQYNFYATDAFSAYGIGGLQIARASVDLGSIGSASDTEIGFNVGGGVNLGISEAIDFFGELRFSIGGTEQLLVAAGVLFALGGG